MRLTSIDSFFVITEVENVGINDKGIIIALGILAWEKVDRGLLSTISTKVKANTVIIVTNVLDYRLYGLIICLCKRT